MNNLSKLRNLLLIVGLALGFLSGCGEEEDQGSDFHCSYEVAKSGCNNYDYGPFTSGCVSYNTANFVDGWDIANHCKNTFTDGPHSGGSSCVVNFDYENVQQLGGVCPGTASVASIGGLQSELVIEARWTAGDVDLEVLTPTLGLLASQSPQLDGCRFSGDDRYVQNGPVESVQCQGDMLDGSYTIILTNQAADNASVSLKVTKNGVILDEQTVSLAPGEPQSISVTVQ